MIRGSEWGAKIERGRVTVVAGSGAGALYDIESYDRPGLELKGLRAFGGAAFGVGDKVYMFAFPDGTGMALGAFETGN